MNNDPVDFSQYARPAAQSAPEPMHLPSTGGGGTFDTMDALRDRLARLEGGTSALRWAVGVVSAALIGLGAAVLVVQVAMFSSLGGRMDSVERKIDQLPREINQNLLELNRTMLQAIQTGRDSASQGPAVVIEQHTLPPSVTGNIRQEPQATPPSNSQR